MAEKGSWICFSPLSRGAGGVSFQIPNLAKPEPKLISEQGLTILEVRRFCYIENQISLIVNLKFLIFSPFCAEYFY